MAEPTRWRVTRTWYVEGVDTADAAIQASKQMPHVQTDAERMPLPDHEEGLHPATGRHVCMRDGQDWPCTAALAAGVEEPCRPFPKEFPKGPRRAAQDQRR